jgi:hypothetical protein
MQQLIIIIIIIIIIMEGSKTLHWPSKFPWAQKFISSNFMAIWASALRKFRQPWTTLSQPPPMWEGNCEYVE